ncbi:MAG: ABC transporter ATP-binding protein, partial [Acidobacteria bacterium]|nr:ABC transporter ATP-binding protein [Acidobacteriota bacterium]
GPNGSGKSTIIRTILNIVRRDAGSVQFFGLDVNRHELEIKRRLGVYLEEPNLFGDLRVEHLFGFFSSFYPSWDRLYADELLRQLPVDPEERFGRLSKGRRAGVALVAALGPKPGLLILDEPTSGLDPTMRKWFVEKVREARAHYSPAMLLTSHILRDVDELADRIVFMQDGRIKVEELRASMSRWRVIEGVGHREFGLLPASMGMKLERTTGGVIFRILTDGSRREIVEGIEASGGSVTGVHVPDLDEIYDLVITGQVAQRGTCRTAGPDHVCPRN